MPVLNSIQKPLESSVGVWVAVGKKDLVVMVNELKAESKGVVLPLLIYGDRVLPILDLTASPFPAFVALD